MGIGKNIRLSSIVLFLLAAALAVLSTPDFIYGQSGIEMEVDGDLVVKNGYIFTVVGEVEGEGEGESEHVLTDDAGNIRGEEIADGSVGTSEIANDSVTPGKLDDTLTYSMGKVGIGTNEVPKGGIGGGRLAIHGPTASDVDGPHIQMTVQSDNYPVSTLFSFSHNSCGLLFDGYKDGSFKSSYQLSNLIVWKFWNHLLFSFAHNITPGADFLPLTGFSMDLTSGSIMLPYVYGETVGSPNRVLYIDSTGKLGYLSSSIELKENVRDTTEQDTAWIYGLRPVMFDYKDHTMGENQCGLIAEEVETVNPRIVSYKRDISYGPEQLDENGQPTGYHPMIVTITNQPETVCYDQLSVPMLAEMQRLKTRVDELEARVAQLETLEARVAALEAKQ